MVEKAKKDDKRVLKSKKFGGEYTFGKVLGKGAQAVVYKFQKNSGEN